MAIKQSSKKTPGVRLAEVTSKRASTMEELLATTGYTPKGLSRGQKVEGTIVEIGPKSVTVDLRYKSEGLIAEREFESARAYIKTLKPGDVLQAMVVAPEGEGGYVLLSLRETADEFVWKTLEEKSKRGEEVEVRVENATRGGLTASVYGIAGFIPTSHLSGDLAQNPQSAQGKTMPVKIIEVDREKNRLVLSEKAVSQSEFLQKQKEMLNTIKKGEKFTGRVVKVVTFGVFVEIIKDEIPVEGLVHLSEISWNKVATPAEALAEGDEVETVVIGKEGEKLALSIKQTQEDPWTGAIGKYHKDDQVTGSVTKVGEFGAFVELEAGVEGLVRAEKIPAEKPLKEGEEVKVFIEDIDNKNHKLSLGLVLTSVPVGYR